MRYNFNEVNIDKSWSFADLKRKETTYASHGYHRYPAKFIPQLAQRLIRDYSDPGDLVVDPFLGCGTTLVESKIMGRPSVGSDCNPTSILISCAKCCALLPEEIEDRVKEFFQDGLGELDVPCHDRIAYWFRDIEIRKLNFILARISKIEQQDIRSFFLCGFSNILKPCSIWLQKSNKPTRDLKKFLKKDPDVGKLFYRQLQAMLRGNRKFFEILKANNCFDVRTDVQLADARQIHIPKSSARLVVTSPPYVTSYEYADLHQLSTLWFKYADDLGKFREQFIGSAYQPCNTTDIGSETGADIVAALESIHKKTASEVKSYFVSMNEVFQKVAHILRPSGHACIVIGNTKIKGVEVLNAEVYAEQLANLGLYMEKVIKREIPSKNLPSVRDKTTGRFSKNTNDNKVYVYPTEYILVLTKA